MTRGTIYVAVASAVLALAAPAFAELKIGIVDLQRALNESTAGKKAKEQFKVEFDRMQGSLKGEKDKLDKMKEDLDKQSAVLKADDRKAKADEFERRQRDLRRKLEDSDAELRKKDQELTGDILKDLAVVIQEIGERENYTVVLENSSSSVLYGAKSIDMTDEVIKTFDARKK
ncbi:MAG TPA: OmpH family outer membrane protein [Candidatus Binatia bacterium]|jgi:outer membrane protein